VPFAQVSTDTSLFYTEHGSGGPPVILLHGWTCDSNDWIWQIPELAQSHKVFAVDLRGHGHSSVPLQGYGGADYANDISRLIQELGCGPAIVIAHSLGGCIGVHLAVEHPDDVLALIAVDPAYGTAVEGVDLGDFIALLRSEACFDVLPGHFASLTAATTPKHLTTWYIRRALAVSQHVISESIAGMVTNNIVIIDQDMLKRRRCPTLTFFRFPGHDAWETAAPGQGPSKIVTWEGSGHWLNQERPAEFNALISDWLDGLGLRRAQARPDRAMSLSHSTSAHNQLSPSRLRNEVS
jgi:pimeloyl-ACP methyl ester carboxylesterase